VTRAEQLASLASGPFLAACSLLVVAGAAKIGNRSILGAAEITVGVAGAVFGGLAAALVASTYAALAGYVVHLLRHAPDKPCECLGPKSAPVTRSHLALNVGAATVAGLATFGKAPVRYVIEQPLGGVPYLVLVACCTWIGTLVLGAYADLRAASSEGHR